MSPRLTIVGLNFAPEPTGIAPYTTSLAYHLAEHGWTVKVITGYPHYPQWQVQTGFSGPYRRTTAGKVKVLHLRHYVPPRPRLVNRLLMELHFGLKAARTDWGQPDIVLLVSPGLFASAIVALVGRMRRTRPRIVLWVQDLYGQGFQESHAFASAFAAPMQRIESTVLRAADEVVVIHDRFAIQVVDRLQVPPERVKVIRNWTHIKTPEAQLRLDFRRRYGWRNDDVVVLHAGNMGLKQHLENVVDAARVADSHQSPVRFVLLGNGSQRRRLEELAEGVERVQFIDPLPDDEYSAVLASADILLVNELPGVRDMALPSKLTSYFITGRPIIAAVESDSATADEIRASGAGIVVSSGDPAALVAGAEQLAAEPDSAENRGSAGQRYAKDKLSLASAVERWDRLLTSLLPG